ncbi:MAG: imelysin family protein [Microthrixaceae bacterium]|nr:imelysin family protein [Microthrixaceae bacterium]
MIDKFSFRRRSAGVVTTTVAIVCTVVLVASALGGCSKSDSGDSPGSSDSSKSTDRIAALKSIANDVIVPGLAELSAATSKFANSVGEYCAAPTPDGLAAARQDWTAAADAWASTASYRFGPAAKLRSAAGISYPINMTKIDKMFSAGGDFVDTAPTVESVAGLGADKRGLGAIEYLLFIRPDGIGSPTVESANQCAFIVAAATNVDSAALALSDAWTKGSDQLTHPGPYVEQFTKPGSASMYANQQEALDDVVNTMASAMATVGDMVLGAATGKTGADPDPAGADPGPAQRKLDDARGAIDSVRTIYGPKGERLSGIVAAQTPKTGNDADKSFRSTLDAAVAAIDKVPSPIAQMTPEQASTGALVDAFEQVNQARVLLRTEVASALGVTIGFSDSDGDG